MTEIQTFILAGGHGKRLASDRPKALTTIAGTPIVEHLFERLAEMGLSKLTLALGVHLDPFAEHFGLPVQQPDESPGFGKITCAGTQLQLRLLDTGAGCDTGGRLKRLQSVIEGTFLLCWCDGLSDVDLVEMMSFHHHQGSLATVLAVHPNSRFGRLELDGTRVRRFTEKPRQVEEWINGGMFVLEPQVLDWVERDECSFEREILPRLAERGQLRAFRHGGFWHCMDTPTDREGLDRIIRSGQTPWLDEVVE